VEGLTDVRITLIIETISLKGVPMKTEFFYFGFEFIDIFILSTEDNCRESPLPVSFMSGSRDSAYR